MLSQIPSCCPLSCNKARPSTVPVTLPVIQKHGIPRLNVLTRADPASSASTTATPAAPAPDSAPPSPDKAALLARIAKAKQYKQQAAEPGSISSLTPDPPTPSPSQPPNAARPAADWGAMAAFIGSGGKSQSSSPPSAPLSISGLAPDTSPLQASTPSPYTPQGSQAAIAATPEEQARLQAAETLRKVRFEAAKDKMSDEYSPLDTDSTQFTSMVLNATQAPSRGSATRPADFLAAVLSDDQPDALPGGMGTMRMEEYTAAREASIKQMGAEILTVDRTYRPHTPSDGSSGNIVATTRIADAAALLLGPQTAPPPAAEPDWATLLPGAAPPQTGADGPSQGAEEYQPKVTTWGVFPRPKDISKEYGGGRNLAPGQALETPEQRAAREAAYSQALMAYKDKMGLQVDAEAEEQADVVYQEGMVMFAKADLQGAFKKFDRALQLVPLKSRVGGLAGLQKAIILDSQGLSDPAQKLYNQLQGHAVASVSRKAKQMLFGFKAAEFLKADQFSYAPRKGSFDKYFRPGVDRNKIWVASEEDKLADEHAARIAGLVAIVVLLGPMALMASLVTLK